MKRLALLLIGLAATACGTKAAPDHATITQLSTAGARDNAISVSPDGSHIAFWRPGGNGFDLWVADADLKNARSLGVSNLFGNQPPPVWSKDGRQLAIASSAHSLSDVALVDLATDSVTYLTDSPAIEIPIQFHPDGDRVVYLAYASGGTVATFTVSRKSHEIKPLIPGIEHPYLGYVSPDGAHVAYDDFGAGQSTIWLSDADGVTRRQITKDGYEGFTSLNSPNPWSADGQRVLFTSTRTGKPDIWVASLDGTTKQLTTDINSDDFPAWSPDGKRVAFFSDRGRQGDIWIVSDTGGPAVRVTNDKSEKDPPQWLNDSTIAYASLHSPATYWRRPLADTAERRVLPDSIDGGDFWESPDRQWMAFLIDHPGGSADLGVMHPDGTGLRVLARSAHFQNICWNASSSKLAWNSDQSGSPDVYVADVAGDAPAVQLESWPGYDHPAYWSADGKSVVIVSDRENKLGDLWRIPLGGTDTSRLSHIGSVVAASAYTDGGRQHILMQVAEQASGELSLAEWLPGDKLRTIISGNAQFPPQPMGALLGTALPSTGRPVVEVLRPDGSVLQRVDGVQARAFSRDDRQLLYATQDNGELDLGLLDVASGKTTALTHTPENEGAAMFTAGGDSVVFRRVRITSEIMRAAVGGRFGKQ